MNFSPSLVRARRQFIWQIQVAKRVDVLPTTRDSIGDGERATGKPAKRLAWNLNHRHPRLVRGRTAEGCSGERGL